MRIIAVIILMMMCVACNQTGEQEPAVTVGQSTANAVPAQAEVPSEPASRAGEMYSLGDGTEILITSVGGFDKEYRSMAGTVAIEGRVAEVFPDRGAFVLVDYDRMSGCSDDCCPQAELPVRIGNDGTELNLPRQDEVVLVIGELALTETGYDLDVAEVRMVEGAAG